uniref:SFRICE_026702 n=1 Tax=Spodoptera frugiperda TaxID=7108 RepID=A0A2H1W6F4_SPOFR
MTRTMERDSLSADHFKQKVKLKIPLTHKHARKDEAKEGDVKKNFIFTANNLTDLNEIGKAFRDVTDEFCKDLARIVPHATDFSLACIETHTTASTDPHRMDRIIRNAYMRCMLMTSYVIHIAYDAYDAGLWTLTLKDFSEESLCLTPLRFNSFINQLKNKEVLSFAFGQHQTNMNKYEISNPIFRSRSEFVDDTKGSVRKSKSLHVARKPVTAPIVQTYLRNY